MTEVTLSELLVMTKLASSRGEAKRLIKQGAVEIDGVKILRDLPIEFVP